jgi:hypothetical protein
MIDFFISDEIRPVVRGQPVTLTCPVDIENCGELHSIKWFKDSDRIAVLSGDGKFAQVEGVSSERYGEMIYVGDKFIWSRVG